MIHPNDINPFLMLDQGINAIIDKANDHIETTKRTMKLRHRAFSTALFHTVLSKMLEETTIVTMVKRNPVYPEKRYLGNVIMNYLPDHHAWKITITNGGTTRKNAKLPLKIKEIFYLRRLKGYYFVDAEFTQDCADNKGVR